jgi:hypothetical protein
MLCAASGFYTPVAFGRTIANLKSAREGQFKVSCKDKHPGPRDVHSDLLSRGE